MTMAALTANAQTDAPTNSASTNAPTAKPKPKVKRYTGKIVSVDADAKTITYTTAGGESKTIKLTSTVKIKKDGKPAVLADATVGLRVSGTLHEDADGNWSASTVNIGEPKPKAAVATPANPPAPDTGK